MLAGHFTELLPQAIVRTIHTLLYPSTLVSHVEKMQRLDGHPDRTSTTFTCRHRRYTGTRP